jgi:hypothetical protein
MPHLDTISFFIVALPICAAAFVLLWNCSFANRLRFTDGLRFVIVWMLFTVVGLVMNQIGRETLDPGRWPGERLFHGLPNARLVGAETTASTAKNLLLGWALFPLRVVPLAKFYIPAIAVGMVATLFALVFTEICGRLVTGKRWQIRWTFCAIGAFWLLFFTTYSTVGLVRQLGWILF